MNRFYAAAGCGLLLVVSSLLARVHPFGDAGLYAKQQAQSTPFEDSPIPPGVRAILISKCADCHSAQTHAPFYGHFAPVSWLMERDVIQGRDKMNFSKWGSYSSD